MQINAEGGMAQMKLNILGSNTWEVSDIIGQARMGLRGQ